VGRGFPPRGPSFRSAQSLKVDPSAPGGSPARGAEAPPHNKPETALICHRCASDPSSELRSFDLLP